MPQLTTRRGLIVGVAAALAAALLPGRDACAETFIVNPGESIQAAIDMAVDGDEVVVMPGTYTEAIDFLGKAITVRSDQGAGVTVLTAPGLSAPVVTWQTGEGATSVLQGIAVERGTGLGASSVGASPTIADCTFANSSTGYALTIAGGGAPTVRDCLFQGSGRHGNAVLVQGAATGLSLERCTFEDLGTALRSSSSEVVSITDCDFVACGATTHAIASGRMAVLHSEIVDCSAGLECIGNSTVEQTTFRRCIHALSFRNDLLVSSSTFEDNEGVPSPSSPGGGRGVGPGAAIAFVGFAGARLQVRDSVFRRNVGGRECNFAAGGAVRSSADQTTFESCIFEDNISDSGGAMNASGEVLIANSIFRRNVAEGRCEGGGALRLSGSATIVSSVFEGNYVQQYPFAPEQESGGAIWLRSSGSLEAINCTFIANETVGRGGAVAAAGPTTLISCSGAGNTAAIAGSFVEAIGQPASLANCAIDGFGALVSNGAVITIDNSVLDTSWIGAGVNNLIADPLFQRNPSPGPDGAWGTDDDDYGDLRLRPGSPCIDAGDNAIVPADALDLDGDGDTAEPLPFDLAGSLRIVNATNYLDTGLPAGASAIVDIGGYEAAADLPPPPCPCERTGDDPGAAGAVDVFDLLAYLDLWFDQDPRAELSGDEPANVDVIDLLAFLDCWFSATGAASCP